MDCIEHRGLYLLYCSTVQMLSCSRRLARRVMNRTEHHDLNLLDCSTAHLISRSRRQNMIHVMKRESSNFMNCFEPIALCRDNTLFAKNLITVQTCAKLQFNTVHDEMSWIVLSIAVCTCSTVPLFKCSPALGGSPAVS